MSSLEEEEVLDTKSKGSLRLCVWLRTNSPLKHSFNMRGRADQRKWGMSRDTQRNNVMPQSYNRSTGNLMGIGKVAPTKPSDDKRVEGKRQYPKTMEGDDWATERDAGIKDEIRQDQNRKRLAVREAKQEYDLARSNQAEGNREYEAGRGDNSKYENERGKIVVDCEGRSGGICMFWISNLDVVLLSLTKSDIDVKWKHLFQYSKVKHLYFGGSDHRVILVKVTNHADLVSKRGMRPIKRESIEPVNKTLITLILKSQQAEGMADYRPISLYNVTYKIVARTLANRLCGVMCKVISDNQSAFMLGMIITDITIIGFECPHAIKRRKRKDGSMALKLDMSKAYDRVEWSFLIKMMEKWAFRTNGLTGSRTVSLRFLLPST
ncbi:hypothetical protein Dsin_019081 [Dipteronia sinensis]|uniref:Reverse transcriptase domain-containing protein n=1 Tax=Dipteronia sinensis TaxID=43782 RepID=A0AAE0A6I3_9ROSI|nr:hypothetical protein Dsin_019081 [Dipteronia sinensis]